MRSLQAAHLLPAVVLLGLLAPGTAAGGVEAASPLGINIHAPSGETLQPLLAAVEEAGFGWVRIDVVWAEIETQPGHYDWRRIDEVVVEARARGLSLLGILAYTPAWATEGEPFVGVPRDGSGWGRFCFHAASRYAGLVAAWEIWNEPNLDRFWAGSRREWIDLILRPAAAAVREADPEARVAGPALAHHGDADWHHWLYEVLREAGDELDVVSHHVYAASDEAVTRRLTDRSPFAREPALWSLASPSVREVLELVGWRGPFWLTETGWQARGANEPFQAAKYGGLLHEWFRGRARRDWIERVFFYELQDAGDTHWGILRVDRRRKPAWIVVREFVGRYLRPPPLGPPQEPSARPRVDKKGRGAHPNRGS